MARPKAFDETQALQRATEIFWRKGYHQTSMQDLVDGMGINRASLYDTFGDKHALYMKALGIYMQKTEQEQRELSHKGLSPRDQIRAMLLNTVEEGYTDTDGKSCFLTKAALEMTSNDPEVAGFICASFKETRDILTQLIAVSQRMGTIKNQQSAEDLAFFLQSSIIGLRVMAYTNPPRSAMLCVVDKVMQVLT